MLNKLLYEALDRTMCDFVPHEEKTKIVGGSKCLSVEILDSSYQLLKNLIVG